MQYYPSMGRKNTSVIRTFKGVSTLNPYQIGDDKATVGFNMDGDSYPAVKSREPLKSLGGDVYTSSNLFQCIFRHRRMNGGIAVEELFAFISAKVFKWTGTTWTMVQDIFPGFPNSAYATNDIYATNYMGYMLFTNGADNRIYKYDGSISPPALSISSFGTIEPGTATRFFNYLTTHKNRLFYALDNRITFSNLNNMSDWTTPELTGSIEVETTDGEVINGLHVGNSRLLVFKPNAMYELLGETPYEFGLVKVTDKLGLVNGKCAVNVEGITYFMHTTGVYAYNGGRPRKISAEMDAHFTQMDWKSVYAKESFMGTDGKRLYCNLSRSKMLVYHLQFGIWYEWGIGANCMLSEEQPLFGQIVRKIVGFTGTVLETSTDFQWTSKPMNTGALNQKWRLNRMWLTMDIVSTSRVDVYLSKTVDGNDWSLVKSITGTSLNNHRVSINPSVANNANVIRVKLVGNGPFTLHEIVRESRVFPLV